MRLVFVHGWSVTSTKTYGSLPQSLASGAGEEGLDLDIQHIDLGKYVSFHDEVTLDDIARAFDCALRELPGNSSGHIASFSAITHSTGGPVVRQWIENNYGASKLAQMPLRHLVMLAPANHGSPLAALGKKRVGRIKAWFDDVQPGQRVLDWLSLGSEGQWNLNAAFRSYQCAGNGFFPFVLTGQGIDRSAYDFLNSYLTESGSDGVVRIAGANMNCRYISLQQTGEERHDTNDKRTYLKLASRTARAVSKPQKVPLGVFSCFSHTGTDMGIMAIKQRRSDHQRIVSAVLDCLLVVDSKSYRECGTALAALTAKEQLLQAKGRKDPENRYSMLVFRVRDENGGALDSEDVDVFLTAGNSYSKDHLPSGFSRDVQLNKRSNNLVFYLDAHRMSKIDDGMWGFQVVVRPEDGFSYYRAAEFRSEGLPVASVIAPNETTYVDVALNRCVDKNVFRFADASAHRESFKSVKPSGDEVP